MAVTRVFADQSRGITQYVTARTHPHRRRLRPALPDREEGRR